jgi:hypothetical protein
MKKILLSLICLTLFAGAFAQSFSLQDTNGVAINAGATFYISGLPSDEIITARIDIKNNSDVSKDVKVKKTLTAVLPNTMNYFCWGVCYGPDTFVSPYAQPVAAGTVSNQFYGDYSALGVIGTSTIMYTFFDVNNPNDSVAVYVEFNAAYPPVQSFSLQDTNGVVIDAGATVQVLGLPTATVITAKIWIKNESAEAKDVMVKKIIYEGDTLTGTVNNFCWGLCYPPDTYVSPYAQTIQPGAVCDQFYGDYNPNNVPGKSKILFVFYDLINPNDSIAVTVEFNASPASIGDDLAKSVKFSEAYPNPAISKVNVDYSLPSGVSKASIKISNMLGAKIKEIRLDEKSGTAKIDVGEYQNGIYFYTLVADNQQVMTRKFVVRH